MRTIRLTNFAFALLCLFLSNSIASGQSPAHNQPTQSQNAYCKAWSSDQATIYFSDVFESDVPSSVILNRGIESLFEAHLKQSYGYSSTPNTPVVCVLSSSEEKKKQELAQYTMMGKQLVETRWKMSPQQAAALAVPAALPTPKECYLGHGESGPCPAAAPKPSSYIVCRAVTSVLTQGKRTTYFSDVMPRANVDQAGYSAAFVAFLAKKYGVQGVNPDPSMCPTVPSEAEGHRLVEEGWWKVNPYTSTSVQTGWTYSSASPPEAHATAAPPSVSVTSYTVCIVNDASTAYVSAAFAVTTMDNPSWTNGFSQFLAQNYSYKGGGVGCNNMDLEHAPTFLKNRIAGLRANKKQVVETGWTYGSSASAPATPTRPSAAASGPPAAAVAVTAPNVTHSVCWADFDAHTQYYSAVFDGTIGDYNVWMPAFKKFLEQKYHYMGLVRCTKRPDKADAQKYLDNMVSTARGITLGAGAKAKVIETGWKYQ